MPRLISALIAFSSFYFIFASCATVPTRLYEGPELPIDSVAVLKRVGVQIYGIDGKTAPWTSGAGHLLPGSHTLRVGFFYIGTGGAVGKSSQDVFLIFDAEKGHSYALRNRMTGEFWTPVITERREGKDVVVSRQVVE